MNGWLAFTATSPYTSCISVVLVTPAMLRQRETYRLAHYPKRSLYKRRPDHEFLSFEDETGMNKNLCAPLWFFLFFLPRS
jgi:hypothetical protein